MLREACELCRTHRVELIRLLPEAYAALAGDRDPADVEVGTFALADIRLEAHVVLHRCTGTAEHRERSREVAEHLARHLDAAGRERFWTVHPLAWKVR